MKSSTMAVSSLQLFKILKDKLGESQAESLVEYVDSKVSNEFEDHKDTFASKQDIARLETRIESTSKQTLIWMFGMMVTLLGLTVAAMKLL